MTVLAIGVQFAQVFLTHPRRTEPSVKASQAIIIPHIGQVWYRQVSHTHPRGRWAGLPGRYDLATTGWKEEHTDRLIKTAFPKAEIITGALFPIVFQVADAELDELGKHNPDLPRNTILRFQNALKERGALLFGKESVSWDKASTYEVQNLVDPTGLSRDVFVHETLRTAVHAILTEDDPSTGILAPYIIKSGRVRRKRAKASELSESRPSRKDLFTGGIVEAPADPEAPVKPGSSLTRPNGQVYIARSVDADIEELSDIDLFRRAHSRGTHILAFGEPGTGKTAGFEVAFPGLITMIGTAETEADHFVGSYVVTLGADGKETLLWEDGPLVRAMESGVPLFVDEIGVIPPNQLTVLFSVMDGRGELRVTANPSRGIVKAKKGFGIIAATNPNAPGVRLSEALLSRFGIKVEIGTNYKAARKLGVNRRIVDAAEHLAKQCTTGEASWAPQMRELLQFRDDEESIGLVFALRNLINNVPEMERDVVQAHLQERFGDVVKPERLVGLRIS